MQQISTSRRRRLGALTAVCATLGLAAPAQAERIFGLTSTNALVTFDSAAPSFAGMAMAISGLSAADERILGIDLRASDNALYGLGSAGNIYTLNASTGAATLVATLAADPTDISNPFTALSGTSFGMDFNPVVDRLRITSNAGQNLRINVATGGVTTDGALNGATMGISASAYTNNDTDPATGTALYGINGMTGMLYTQAPPNDGTQTAVGSLGVLASNVAGFDISGITGIGYAALTNPDTAQSSLYTVNLTTGAATLLGAFGYGGNTAMAPPLLGIAIAPVPEPATYAMMFAGLAVVGAIVRRRRKG
jgi:hypothetical protein